MWIDLLTHSFPTRRSSDLLRKGLAASENRTCTNPVLDMAAERGLNPLVPDARDVARQHVEQKYRERAEGQRSAGQREAAVFLLDMFGFDRAQRSEFLRRVEKNFSLPPEDRPLTNPLTVEQLLAVEQEEAEIARRKA